MGINAKYSMLTFAQFLEDKRMVLFGVAAAQKKDGSGPKQSGGAQRTPGMNMAKPNFKPPKKIFDGMPVPGEIFAKK